MHTPFLNIDQIIRPSKIKFELNAGETNHTYKMRNIGICKQIEIQTQIQSIHLYHNFRTTIQILLPFLHKFNLHMYKFLPKKNQEIIQPFLFVFALLTNGKVQNHSRSQK